jgi:signal transduction histidine kinase
VIPHPALLSLLLLSSAAGQDALTRALDIRTLPYERSLEKLPVDLTATISFVESGGTVFIQDASAGTHLHFKPARHDLRVGDRVRVKGSTMAGLYLPGVDVTELSLLGHETAPEAVTAGYEDLASGRYHYQRVSVEGLGLTLAALDENRSLLRLAMGSRVIEVRIDAALESAPDLIDARLRITALAAGGINDRRQLVFPYLRVTDWDDVSVMEAPPKAASLPVSSVAELLPFGSMDAPRHRAKIRGTVLAAFPDGRVFLRDLTAPLSTAIAIRLTAPADLTSGHVAEALGFPIMAGFSASLADACLLSTEPGPPAKAETASLKDFQNGSHDANLIQLSTAAILEDLFRTSDGYELRFTAAETPLRAFLIQAEEPRLQIGSVCELTGICLVEPSTTDKGFRSAPNRAALLLRSTADIRILSTAPFWTARRLVMTTALLGGMMLITLIWITLQRRQIARLKNKIALQATLDERQRIAREFHDTLEQELTGLSLRLDAAMTRPLEDKAGQLIQTSRSLVSRIQSEARNLVADLRDTEHTTTLAESLQELSDRLPEGIALKLDLQSIPDLSPPVTHHLRMIAQEAITNAIKHAEATEISLHLSTTSGQISLRIRDNGHGFDPITETMGKPGHFGCMGIRERARKVGADVRWESAEGKGTSVCLSLPLAKISP